MNRKEARKTSPASQTTPDQERIAVTRHPVAGIPVYEGELWTARQRQMNPLHYAVSYRASFKPELPDFFIQKYMIDAGKKKGRVLDPFGGRGTTALQANLLGFMADHNDLNPVSLFISRARSEVAPFPELKRAVEGLDLSRGGKLNANEKERLEPFFHPDTLQEIVALRRILLEEAPEDPKIRYIGLTALSRLHGHSNGYFSVYSFPQISILPRAQKKNNLRRGEEPVYKPIKSRIVSKMKRDLQDPLPDHFHSVSRKNRFLCHDSRELKGVPTSSVDLIVTSPPFLDKVDYLGDNWMRAWFLGLEEEMNDLTLGIFKQPGQWAGFMEDSMKEMARVLKPGGKAVIEVGEVQKGKDLIHLEDLLISKLPMKVRSGVLEAKELYINRQKFTKLANCWDVTNNSKGTNTNRCLVLEKRKA